MWASGRTECDRAGSDVVSVLPGRFRVRKRLQPEPHAGPRPRIDTVNKSTFVAIGEHFEWERIVRKLLVGLPYGVVTEKLNSFSTRPVSLHNSRR